MLCEEEGKKIDNEVKQPMYEDRRKRNGKEFKQPLYDHRSNVMPKSSSLLYERPSLAGVIKGQPRQGIAPLVCINSYGEGHDSFSLSSLPLRV